MEHAREHRPKSEAAFTLVELLIVIAVLGILAAVVIFAVGNAVSDSRASACAADHKTLSRASEAYKVTHGQYPATLTDMTGTGGQVRQDGSISATTKVGDGYTVTYNGAGAFLCTVGDTAPVAPAASTMTASADAGTATFTGNGANRIWTVPVTISVVDDLGGTVTGAAVTGTWTFTFDGNSQHRGTGTPETTCTTVAGGTCTLVAAGMESNVAGATATLASVVKSGLTWSHPSVVAASQSRPF